MIVVDANLLLYAHDTSDPHHLVASRWLTNLMSSDADVGLALMTILAFLRISTDGRVYERPRTPKEAIDLVASWLGRPNVRLLAPTEGHWRTLADQAARGQARGPHLMDAHLATLTIEHGGTLASTDRDFGRFPGLRTIDPLA